MNLKQEENDDEEMEHRDTDKTETERLDSRMHTFNTISIHDCQATY